MFKTSSKNLSLVHSWKSLDVFGCGWLFFGNPGTPRIRSHAYDFEKVDRYTNMPCHGFAFVSELKKVNDKEKQGRV